METSLLNESVLYYTYTIIGFVVVSCLIYVLRFIVRHTKNKFDDKIVDVLSKWHEINKDKIKK